MMCTSQIGRSVRAITHSPLFLTPTTPYPCGGHRTARYYFPIHDASAVTALIGDYVYMAVRMFNGQSQKLVRTRITINGANVFALDTPLNNPPPHPREASPGATTTGVLAAVLVGIVVVVGMKATRRMMRSFPAVLRIPVAIQNVLNDASPDYEWDDAGL